MELIDIIAEATQVLKNGGTLLYPTDTVWGIGCDATNAHAVEKIYRIKQRSESKSLIVLLDQAEKLKKHVKQIPETFWDLLANFDNPTTVIYPEAMNLARNVIAADGTIAIRVVNDPFCKQLVHHFQQPIVSTSANISGNPTPLTYQEIDQHIKDQVDYIVPLYQDRVQEVKPSTILKLHTNGNFQIIRK